MSDARLRWQCRRGMRELDELLGRYLEQHYPDAPEEEKAAFRELLMLPDPELAAYILRGDSTGRPVADRLLRRLRR